jgi:hypothetical protein
MTKIKIVGGFVFILSLLLIIISSYISKQNKINSNIIDTISEQKAYTQEISKNIFYIYNNKNCSTKNINIAINGFLENLKHKDETLKVIPSILIKNQSEKIIDLWNQFYIDVQKFIVQKEASTAYTNILLEKLVNNIYKKNQILITEFNNLKKIHQIYFDNILNTYKNIQYILFTLLILLLIYLFSQVKLIISFIQEFTKRSEKVIKNSSIRDIKPIKEDIKNKDINEATNNFNLLVDKLNNSIKFSHNSIEQTTNSLKEIENNIEQFLEILSLNNQEIDIDLMKKEDAVIQSLDELMRASTKLNNLKSDLNKIINLKN